MPFSFHNIQLSQWILANETWRGRRLTIMSQISKWIVQKTYPIRYAIRFWHVTSGIKFSKAKDKYQLGTETLWPNNKKILIVKSIFSFSYTYTWKEAISHMSWFSWILFRGLSRWCLYCGLCFWASQCSRMSG